MKERRREEGEERWGKYEREKKMERRRIMQRVEASYKDCAKHTNKRITIMAVRVVQIRYRLEGSVARARDPLKGLVA